jgi:hypothetical protein
VYNEVGFSTSSSASLVVIAPPVISTPTGVTAKIGTIVTLSVTASGTGTLSYKWYTAAGVITGATATSYTFTVALSTCTAAGGLGEMSLPRLHLFLP